jgi:signal transduction histidine kinase
MRVGVKILAPQILQFLLLLLVCGMMIAGYQQYSRLLGQSHERIEVSAFLADQLNSMQANNALSVLSYRIDRAAVHLRNIAAYEKQAGKMLAEYSGIANDRNEQMLLRSVQDAHQRNTLSRADLILAMDSGDDERVQASFRRWQIHQKFLVATLKDLAGFNFNRLRAAVDQVASHSANFFRIAAYGALAFVFLILLGIYSVRQDVNVPLVHLTTAIDDIRRGNLSPDIHSVLARRDDEFGQIAGAFAIMAQQLRVARDTLEQRVQERTLQLDASNKELEAFAYSVSHDLRVPLRAIDGFSHMLEQRYREQLDDEARRLIGVVRDNAKKMGHLIDDILAFSRMGRKEIAQQAVDMAALVQAAIEEVAPNEQERKFELQIDALPPTHGDGTMLRQVWVNLIGNAIKFSRTRDHPKIEIGTHSDNKEQVYYVKDNGVGFDMQYAPKLFGVFQRLHAVDEFEGTGIGLAIVKRIITRHGGRVWAEAQLNAGATLYFALPFTDTPGTQPPDQYHAEEKS